MDTQNCGYSKFRSTLKSYKLCFLVSQILDSQSLWVFKVSVLEIYTSLQILVYSNEVSIQRCLNKYL